MNILNFNINDFCAGCGICVSACPSKHLNIGYNEYNQLSISSTANPCISSCNICVSVCPFSNQSESETDISKKIYNNISNIKFHPETGYYLDCYVGHHPQDHYRLESASGGLTTYLLSQLLKEKEIDAAIVVTKNNRKPYFSYTYSTDSEEVYNHTRSAYCAVQMNDVIDKIISDDRVNNVAIVALPCFCKALRNACRKMPKLNKKVKYLIGLVCGQQKTYNFTTYLASKNQIKGINGITFRTKNAQRPNGNFGTKLQSIQGEKEIILSSYAKEWSFHFFTVRSCNYCDDIFAETADIALMDAWLPQYKNSAKGENLVLCRNEKLNSIIRSIPTSETIGIEQIIQSQQHVIHEKRKALTVRLKMAKRRFKYVPQKREHLLYSASILEYWLIAAKYKISTQTDKIWVECDGNYSLFRKKTKKLRLAIFAGLLLNKIRVLIGLFKLPF